MEGCFIEQEIKILNDRQQAREKLPIFFGSRDNYVHGVKELIANAADELKNHREKDGVVIVELHDSNTRISVADNGRGIPIEGVTGDVPNYELLFLTLFAGTKYDVTDSITTGTNGVGNTVVNYTSKYFDCVSMRNGKKYNITFENGGNIKNELSEKVYNEHTGTKITIELDSDIYTSVVFNPDEIRDIVRHFAVASLGIEVYFQIQWRF